MNDGIQFKLLGVEKLSKRIKFLDREIRRKGVRFGLRKASNIVAEKARQNADKINDPNTENSISKNIAVSYSSRFFKTTGNHKTRIGVRGGAKSKEENEQNPGKDTFYWRFKELGTEHERAKPFLRPALENNISAVIKEFAVQTDKSIDRALKRAAK